MDTPAPTLRIRRSETQLRRPLHFLGVLGAPGESMLFALLPQILLTSPDRRSEMVSSDGSLGLNTRKQFQVFSTGNRRLVGPPETLP